ncbi:MAG: hypothetical protein R6W66_07385 [Pelovirga sp.]
MNRDYDSTDKAARTGTDPSNPGTFCFCKEAKQSVANRLRRAAAALDKTAAAHEESPGLADFEKHAARWLYQSSDYMNQFDCGREVSRVRDRIARSPGRSLVIAGAVGLVLGLLSNNR